MNIYVLSVLVSLLFLLFTFRYLAQRKLDFRYVLFWIVLCILLGTLSINMKYLDHVAQLLEVYYAPSLLFAAAMVFVLAFVFYITLFISNITKRVIRLTQEVGLLKRRLEEYEQRAGEEAQ